jgi:hypothetical protein
VRQRPPSQPLTSERRERFLAALSECGNIGQAAREASPGSVGDASATFRDARRKDPDGFGAAVEDALEAYRDKIRAEAHRRGVVGIPVDVRDPNGVVIGTKLIASDRVLLELMRGRLSEHQPVKRVEAIVQQTVTHDPSRSLGLDRLSPQNQDKLREILEDEMARGRNATTAAKPSLPQDEDES